MEKSTRRSDPVNYISNLGHIYGGCNSYDLFTWTVRKCALSVLLKVPVFMFDIVSRNGCYSSSIVVTKVSKNMNLTNKDLLQQVGCWPPRASSPQYNDTQADQKEFILIINQRISICLAFSSSSFLLNNHMIYFYCGALIAVEQSWGQSCSDDFKRHFTDVKLSVSPQLLSVCYFSDITVVVRSLYRLIVGNQTVFKESWKLQNDHDIRAHDECILNTALLDQSSEKVCSVMNFNQHKPC